MNADVTHLKPDADKRRTGDNQVKDPPTTESELAGAIFEKYGVTEFIETPQDKATRRIAEAYEAALSVPEVGAVDRQRCQRALEELTNGKMTIPSRTGMGVLVSLAGADNAVCQLDEIIDYVRAFQKNHERGSGWSDSSVRLACESLVENGWADKETLSDVGAGRGRKPEGYAINARGTAFAKATLDWLDCLVARDTREPAKAAS